MTAALAVLAGAAALLDVLTAAATGAAELATDAMEEAAGGVEGTALQ